MVDDAMHADPQLQRQIATPQRPGLPAIGLMVVFLLAWILAVYWRTTYSMVAIWERSETFAHGFVVIPIFLYLLWRGRDHLATIEPKPFLPALLGVVAMGAVWLVGDRLSIVGAKQLAMMAMIPLAVWTVLGTQALKVLLFPLAFLFFAVPLGEFLVPPLMNWTADFTTVAIQASGVPVFREGNLLTIPSGQWSIVEACSGVRYLIASFMVGCLFAYLSYRSPIRRAAFVAASLVVPIIANWLRAYMIVMLGHLSNNRLAVGADHLIYGWVFFGVVMLLLFWIGIKWREDDRPQHAPVQAVPAGTRPVWNRRSTWMSLAGALMLTALWPLLALQHVSGRGNERALDRIADRAGWTATSKGFSNWRPDVVGATAELAQAFENRSAPVGLFIAFFSDSSPESKAITSTNQLVRTSNRQWAQVSADAIATTIVDGRPFNARATVIARGRERLAVWQWYWVDGHLTTSEYAARIYEVLAVIRGHGDPVAWIVVFTPTDSDEQQVRATLQSFTDTMRDPIDAVLRKAAEGR
jgi:exosortase A